MMLQKKLDGTPKYLFHLELYNKIAYSIINRDYLMYLRFQLDSSLHNQLFVSMDRHLLPVKYSVYFDYDIDDHNERHKNEV
jgi:hypothetical protein